MSSAFEYAMIMADVEARLEPVRVHLGKSIDRLLVIAAGREVCARRARKLRRRGARAKVVLARRTVLGKARYRWVPLISFEFIA